MTVSGDDPFITIEDGTRGTLVLFDPDEFRGVCRSFNRSDRFGGAVEFQKVVPRFGFEHHVVMNASKTAGILKEAFENYLGWDVYQH